LLLLVLTRFGELAQQGILFIQQLLELHTAAANTRVVPTPVSFCSEQVSQSLGDLVASYSIGPGMQYSVPEGKGLVPRGKLIALSLQGF
jgi:hypothetical protein